MYLMFVSLMFICNEIAVDAYLYPMFMIVVGYLSFVSIDTIDVNLLCLWVP